MKTTFRNTKDSAFLFALSALLFFAPSSLRAQAQDSTAEVSAADTAPSPDDTNDPPSRVARISVIDGSVSLQPGGTGDWRNAMKNRPVTIGDKLWVDNASRAELEAGEASLHLGEMTALSFLNLNEGITQMRLAEGKLNFRVRELRQGDVYEVDTPNLAFTVREAGAFRIDVNENGDFTSVTVLRGKGEIAANNQSYPVNASERADVTGTGSEVKYASSKALDMDALDRWAQERDLREENSPSAKHVNRDTVGYSDLDDYGTWNQEPTYGDVWVPNDVSPDWAPYSYGNWSYVGPWGWTWVDYAPWGFAPFHYGRWHYFGGYWGWCPGPIYAPPFYGPAFVGFLGGGFGFGIGLGFGWFPLGWGEPFHPWYHHGYGYWHGINGRPYGGYSHVNYVYAHEARAVTTASRSTFVNGQAINRSAQHLNAASLRNAQVTNGIHASPTRSSYLGASNMGGHVATPSASTQNRSVVARTAPAAAASHMPVRTMTSVVPSTARAGNSASSARAGGATSARPMSSSRQSQLSANRPPSASTNGASRSGAGSRTWNAQGNSTDSGRAPQGFGSSNRSGGSVPSARNNSQNRPPWSGESASGPYSGNSRVNPNRPPASTGGNRGYSSPRSFSAPRGGVSSAPRSSGGSHSGGGSSRGSSGSASHGGGGSHSHH